MKIRRTKKSDWKRCNEIIKAAVNGTKISEEHKRVLKKRYALSGISKLSKPSDMFVLEKYGNIQVTGKLRDHEIGMIYVNPQYQRQKLGTKMMKHLEEFAKKKKLNMVYVGALHPARGFYKKLSYKKIKCNDNCRMEKEI